MQGGLAVGWVIRSSLLGLLLVAAFLQVWAPYYPLTLLVAGLAACSRLTLAKEKFATVGLLSLLVLLIFHDPASLCDDTGFMDPIVAPRLAQLWQGLELDVFGVVATLSLAAALSFVTPKKWTSRAVLLLSLATTLALPATFTPEITRSFFSEPGNHQASDMRMSVKVFYLMSRNGGRFYPAFYEAYCIRHEVESPAQDLLGFNFPLVWWEWWLLCKTVAGVFWLYQIHVVACLLATYWLTWKVTGDETCAAVPAALWCCYFCHPLITPWWANIEHWVLPWVPLAWVLYFQRREGLSMGLMLLTLVGRPQFGPLLLSPFVLACYRKDWKRAALWTLTGIVAVILTLVHYSQVKSMLPPHSVSGAQFRLSGGWWFMKNCLLFNWDFLPRVHLILGVVLLLAVYGSWLGRKRTAVIFMALQVLPVLLLLKFGYFPVYNYGMPFLPWLSLLAAVPLADPALSK